MSRAAADRSDRPDVAPPPALEHAASVLAFSSRSWRRIGRSALVSIGRHRVFATAAAGAFYSVLAFVPAVAAFGSVFGMIAGPETLARRLDVFESLVPSGVLNLVRGEALHFARSSGGGRLGAAGVFSVASVLSASSAVRAMMAGLNLAFGATERRGWVHRRLLSIAFAAVIAAGLAANAALVLRSADFASREGDLVWPIVRLVLRWSLLFGVSVVLLTVFYRFGPDRSRARWRWVTPGSVAAAVVGLLTSAATSAYLGNWAHYERNFGGLGSVLGLMVWLWVSMIVVLCGAELNHAIECATSAVTDVSGRPPRPAVASGRTQA